PRGKRVQILTNSGAAGILMADAGSELGLEFPDLAPETIEKLKKVMPPFATLSNPMDLTAEIVARPGLLKDAAELIATDPNVDNLVIYLGFVPGAHERLARNVVEVARSTDKLVMVTWFPFPPLEARQILSQAGVPLLPEPARGMRALGKMAQYVATREKVLSRAPEQPTRNHGRVEEVWKILDGEKREGRKFLSEVEAKALLKAWGLTVPKGGLARSAGEARSLAESIGWPVVMKVSSPDLLHKTEAGVVRLGLSNPAQVEQAFSEVMEKAKRWNPDARLDGVLVEEMIGGQSREVIVGARQDVRFGPVVTFGLGGILVEAIRDFAVWPAPLTVDEASEVIRKIRAYRALTAFRGRPAADLDALAQVLCRVGALAYELKDRIAEIEINPLFVLPAGEGVRVGDALAVLQ
ncbi:MAG TPA: acetate--CoA ligase family protein, partial [bacterium]|nr:acetate--CoA ligase family protein [bacterium]